MEDIKTVSIIQHSPVYLNKTESLSKAIELISESAGNKSQLAVFGETWLSGYPAWLDYCPDIALWDHEPAKELFAVTYANSVSVDGTEIELLKRACKAHKINCVIGINEIVKNGRGNGSIYNSLLTINEDGHLVNHHRKLMPTYTEKMVYAHGDGAGLKNSDLSVGKVGGLICWEHWMPLSRQALHNAGEDIHVAVWPKVHEMHQIASRQYAFEGRCHVLAAGQILRKKDLPDFLNLADNIPDDPGYLLLNGASAIIGPDGFYIKGPVMDEEKIIYAEIDLNKNIQEKMTLDVSGHYQREDIFDFTVDFNRKKAL